MSNFWFDNAIIYHIYPLGFCGAPKFNEGGEPVNRLDKVLDWIPHLKEMNVDAIYFGPVFESVEHGYDTIDYKVIDRRLGTNESFKHICQELHKNGIRIVLDGVFNHVGRKFWAFTDIQEKGSGSKYCGWFQNLNFGGQSPYGDNFWYEGWQNHFNLVKLNLRNPEVCDYLVDVINYWIDEFDIDGIRFDAADCIDFDFFKRLRWVCKNRKPDFWMMAEIIHGDYKRWANNEMNDSVTNYECYKGIYSSHNEKNYFEIAYSMNRQHGNGGIYKGINLYDFVDNHDVNRLASTLSNKQHIYNVYTLLYGMPGIPSIYYGSEYGIEGRKENNSDDNLRPCVSLEQLEAINSTLYRHIVKLGRIYKAYPALRNGNYESVIVRNQQLIFKRQLDNQTVYVALNLEDRECWLDFGTQYQHLVDVIGGNVVEVNNGNAHVCIPAFSSMIIVEDDIVNTVAEETVTEPVVSAEPAKELKAGVEYADINGNSVKVIAIAKDSETKEELVVYSDKDNNIWSKPKAHFLDCFH